jgi:hypothetical protein
MGGTLTVRFKLGPDQARETLAALTPLSPWYARPALLRLLEKTTDRGIEISVDSIRKGHTDAQRGYYWLCLNIFAKAQGMTPDEAHGVILCEATGSNETTISGRTYRTPKRRSHDMAVEEYSDLIETLHRCAAFCGCVLPDPLVVA